MHKKQHAQATAFGSSPEMPTPQLTRRLVASEVSGYPSSDPRRGTCQDRPPSLFSV